MIDIFSAAKSKSTQWLWIIETHLSRYVTTMHIAQTFNLKSNWKQFLMKVIREAIYKSIRNDANYSAEEMKKDVVKQFQDQYLLKVNNQDTFQIIAKAW